MQKKGWPESPMGLEATPFADNPVSYLFFLKSRTV